MLHVVVKDFKCFDKAVEFFFEKLIEKNKRKKI